MPLVSSSALFDSTYSRSRLRFCTSASGSNRSPSDLVCGGEITVQPPASFGSTRRIVRSGRRSATSCASIVNPLVDTSTTVVGTPPSDGGRAAMIFCSSGVATGAGASPFSSAFVGDTHTTRSRPTTFFSTHHDVCDSVTSSDSPTGIRP